MPEQAAEAKDVSHEERDARAASAARERVTQMGSQSSIQRRTFCGFDRISYHRQSLQRGLGQLGSLRQRQRGGAGGRLAGSFEGVELGDSGREERA